MLYIGFWFLFSVPLAQRQGTGSIFRENHSKNLHPLPLDPSPFFCPLGFAENGELEDKLQAPFPSANFTGKTVPLA